MIGAALGALGSAALGLGAKQISSAMDVRASRKLRQTSYQDTMSSMREAGLNPILAARSGSLGTTLSTPLSMPENLTAVASANKLRAEQEETTRRQGLKTGVDKMIGDQQWKMNQTTQKILDSQLTQQQANTAVTVAESFAKIKQADIQDNAVLQWLKAWIPTAGNSAKTIVPFKLK